MKRNPDHGKLWSFCLRISRVKRRTELIKRELTNPNLQLRAVEGYHQSEHNLFTPIPLITGSYNTINMQNILKQQKKHYKLPTNKYLPL